MTHHVPPPSSAQMEAARQVVADHLTPTPTISTTIRGRHVFAKMDSLQPVGSFKIRGALAAIADSLRRDPHGAVIASSAGNHGLGIAHAATLLGATATVVVPGNASAAKVAKLKTYDITLIQYGDTYDEAQEHAHALADAHSLHFLSPFNDPNVVAGQATCFDELLAQVPDIEEVVVPIGGGGLMAGCLVSRTANLRHDVKITGVQAENWAAMYHYLNGVAPDDIPHANTIADGLAGGVVEGAVTNALIEENKIDITLVPEASVRRGVAEALRDNGILLEGSSSVGYAALAEQLIDTADRRVAFIASGRNIADSLLREILAETAL
jgi:threonine dehydratase